MQPVFVESHNIVSPLGTGSSENFSQLKKGISRVQLHTKIDIDDFPFWASLIEKEQLKTISSEISNTGDYTRFELLLMASIKDALKSSSVDSTNDKTIFIFSTTKGNISLLEQQPASAKLHERINLHHSAKLITDYFNNYNKPIVISNACISGSFAILFAKRLLESSNYENAIVTGGDTISKFVFSGFKSFQTLSPGRCKPFSSDRDGINLGEAAATIILTTKQISNGVRVSGGAVSNDANHISGPSRTGKELSSAINNAIEMAKISSTDIDFISAHGTATLFNDEMEAKAFNLSHLQDAPVNGLKGYFGHTLGAAGLVESVISILSMKEGVIIPTIGFSESGIFPSINVCRNKIEKEIKHCLKTSSGFGGCNAALVFSKS